ncbi:MAG: DUF4435 domain-containing protein [Vampirovibrio sp.]|nr:DUF4435 domain-containing protein [Vampirovibrio sp.]
MRLNIVPIDIANEIKMSSAQKVWALVEGSTDRKFYSSLFDKTVFILNCSGKSTVLSVLDNLINDKRYDHTESKVIYLVDLDQDPKLGCKVEHPDLFYTDSHDIETMMLNSPAFDKVLSVIGSEEKIKDFKESYGYDDLRQLLLRNGLDLGYMRCLSKIKEYHLTFNSLGFSNFIDERTLGYNRSDLIQEIKNKSSRHNLSENLLVEELEQLKDDADNPWIICAGHDLVNILALAFKKAWATKSNKIDPDLIEQSLLLAYDLIYFQQTELYKSLRQWEQHKGVWILQDNKPSNVS